MLNIGLISNPRSRRNRRGLDEVHAWSVGVPGLIHVALDGQQSLGEILRELARREVGLLVINGGDGTVQRLLTELLERRPFERPPPVAILAGGMANMTAGDLGLDGRPARALHRLIACAYGGDLDRQIQARPILRVENVADAPPQRGMFLGAAAIYDAIEFCCSQVYARGLEGDLGMALTLGRFLLGGLVGGNGRGPLRGHEVALAIDDQPASRGRRLLVLATTLDRLILGSRPFWGVGAASIRVTSIAYPAAQLLRSAPKVLYGWRRATLPPEVYRSGGAERLTLGLDGPFTLDGETFEPEADRPLVVTASDRVRFVRL